MQRKPIVIAVVVAVFLFLFAPRAIAADSPIARFVFITDPQTIAAGALSGALTVQAQDQGGILHKSDETIDLIFLSTSPTGAFLNAAGGPVDPVMNRNTANRTFYYRDTAPGAPMLTVKATGRISGLSWTASQVIRIDASALSSVSSPPSSSAASTTTGGASSSYRAPVAPLPSAPAIQAFAGEDRVVLAGVEEDFIGAAIGLVREPITNARFWWNFGDGQTFEGRSVGHTWREPGIYTVALAVSSGEYAASDYAAVRVIPNQIAISGVTAGEGGAVRITNPAPAAADIGGWILEDDGGRKFFLPVRTLIGAESEVAFANRVTGLAPKSSVTLHYPGGSPVAGWEIGIKHETGEKIGADASAGAASSSPGSSVAALVSVPSRGQGPITSSMQKESVETMSPMGGSSGAASAGDAATRAIGRKSFHAPSVFFAAALMVSAIAAAGFFLIGRVLP